MAELANGWRYQMDEIIARAKKSEVAQKVREAEIALQTADTNQDMTGEEAILAEAEEWAAELEKGEYPAGAKPLRRSE
jgi:HD superfamily phosphodiesterase